jgi:O-antigen/teichoic acid export membrane protein
MLVLLFASPIARLVFRAPMHADLLRVAALGLLAQSLSVVPLAHARARGRSDVFVFANAALLALQISLNVLLLVYLKLGPLAIFVSNALASIVVGMTLVVRLIRTVGLQFSPSAARRLVRYGLPLMATQIATFIATFGDRYVLERHASMTTVGLYALAYQFGFLLLMVGSMPIDLVWEPIRFRLAERPDRNHVLSRAFVYLNVLLVSAALGITLFVGDVLRLMTTPAFYPAASLVPVILVAYVFQSWTGMQDVGIHLRERTEWITLANWLSAGVAAAGYFLLIPRWLGLGAAIATVLAFAVRYLVVSRLSLRLFPVRYQWMPVARIITLAAATAVLSLAIPPTNLATSLALRAMLFVAYATAVWRAGILTEDERTAVRHVVLTRLPLRGRIASTS